MKRLLAPCLLTLMLVMLQNGNAQSPLPDLAILDSLGEHFFMQGQLDSSAFYHRQALALAQEQQDKPRQLNAYNWLFVLHYYAEAQDSMGQLLEKMTPLAEQILAQTPKDFEILSSFWGYKSFYHYSHGELAQNITAVRKALELYEQQPTYDTSELAIKYQNLGIALEEIGAYDQAHNYSKQALELLRPSPTRLNIQQDSLTILTSLGAQLIRLQRYEEAEAYFQRGEKVARRLSTSTEKEALRYTALYYLQGGSNDFHLEYFDRAEIAFRKAQQLLDKIPGFSDLDPLLLRFRTRNTLARGQMNEAVELVLQAKNMIEKHLPERLDQLAATQELLGEIRQQQENQPAALTAFQAALINLCPEFQPKSNLENPQIDWMTYSKNDLLRILRKKGESLRATGELEAAFQTYQLAVQLFHNIRQDYITEASRLFLSEQTIPLFAAAAETAIELQQTEVAFQLVEQSKALLLQEAMRDEEAFELAGVPAELSGRMQQLQLQQTYWERARYDAQVQSDSAGLKLALEERFKISSELYLLQEKIRSEYPAFFELKFGRDPVDFVAITMELLRAESALIEYFVSDDKIFVFGIHQGEYLVKVLPKGPEFSERMNRLLRALQLDNSSDPAQYSQDALAIYQEYLAPVLEAFQYPVSQLYLVPDGLFSYLPFEALLTEAPREQAYSTFPYLIKKYVCSYAYSSTLLVNSLETDHLLGKKFVGFAPDFTSTQEAVAQRLDVGPLRYNMEAVEAIRNLTSGIAYTRQSANKTNFLSPSEIPLVLHLSTHARMDDEDPMGSKIYLADGDISTREIYQLPYSSQMVVLSACETGTGKYYKGEGMMSLARAFMQSGSPSVVTSLWKVDDRSTSELMINFYQKLIKGKNKDAALQEAKLAFLEEKESEMLHHPYYWAAFIHTGNPEAFNFPTNFPYWSLALIGLLGIGMFIFFRKK